MLRSLPSRSALAVILSGLVPSACRPPPRPPASDRCEVEGAFRRSPGGTPEIAPEAAWRARCGARFIDVRERHELGSELGHVPDAQWIPLRRLASAADRWDPARPIVLVCRSGRRSGAAARHLAERGFAHVGSVTGGMLAWHAAGLPIAQDAPPTPVPRAPPRAARALAPEDLTIHLEDPGKVRWTKVATLLTHGHESCVDGRGEHAILGTPGGDAGELLLALAAVEAETGAALDRDALERIFADYVEAFGHFYLHTDTHALERLGRRLAADPGFADRRPLGVEEVEALVRQPPPELETALLAHLTTSDGIGCGHLRLARLYPDEYGIRPGLLEGLLTAFHRRSWGGDTALELEVLEGEHAESAVLEVDVPGEIEAFSAVPMISPRLAGGQVFVTHPRVARFIRRQNLAFLREEGVFEATGIDPGSLASRLDALAGQQLAATLGHLAAGLPVFRARFEGRSPTLEAAGRLPAPAAKSDPSAVTSSGATDPGASDPGR